MPILSDRDRQAVQREFQALVNPVKLTVFSQELGGETCQETERLVREVTECSEKLSMEVFNLVLDREKAEAYGVDRVPAVVVEGAKDFGIRFFGLPGGYEFSNLIDAVIVVSTGQPGLSATTQQALSTLTSPVHIRVFTTPTWPHCPRAVRLAQHMAVASEHVRADCIEATEFPDLAQRYRVMAVPKVVINDRVEFAGALPEPDFLAHVLRAANGQHT